MLGMEMHSQGMNTGKDSHVPVATRRLCVAAPLASCRMHGSIRHSLIANTSYNLSNRKVRAHRHRSNRKLLSIAEIRCGAGQSEKPKSTFGHTLGLVGLYTS